MGNNGRVHGPSRLRGWGERPFRQLLRALVNPRVQACGQASDACWCSRHRPGLARAEACTGLCDAQNTRIQSSISSGTVSSSTWEMLDMQYVLWPD